MVGVSRGRRYWAGAGDEGLVLAGSGEYVAVLYGTLAAETRYVSGIRRQVKRKQVTSEVLDAARSVVMSLLAGVTLAILGLSLLNSFRIARRGNENEGETRMRTCLMLGSPSPSDCYLDQAC